MEIKAFFEGMKALFKAPKVELPQKRRTKLPTLRTSKRSDKD